jgi:hypothetical protein
MDQFNLWGTNGYASSLDDAKNNYYRGGVMDGGRTVGGDNYGGGVQGVLPSVIVTATRQAGGGLNFGDAVWNWGNSTGSGQSWENGDVIHVDGIGHGSMDNWEKAGTIIGGTGLAIDVTENAMKSTQLLANAYSAAKPLQELSFLKGASKVLGVTGLFITGGDMIANGVNYNNGTDAVFGIIALIPGPGWIIGGVYFIGNAVLKHETGLSVGDVINNVSHMKTVGDDFNGNVISGGDY